MNNTSLKKLVCIMVPVWMSAICLLLCFIPFFKYNGELVSGFIGINKLLSSNDALLKVIGILQISLFAVLGLNFIFSLFFAFVVVGKIKVGPAMQLFKADSVSVSLSFASFTIVIANMILSIIERVNNVIRLSAGLFVILAVMLIFIIILFYVLFKFDELAPEIVSKEKNIASKQIQRKNKGAGKTNASQPQHLNRAQRRNEQKNKKK